MSGALLDHQFQAAIVQARSAEDTSQLTDVIDHASVLVFASGFGGSGPQVNPLGPMPDVAAAFDRLTIRSPKRRALDQKPAEPARIEGGRVEADQGTQRGPAKTSI